MTTKEANSRLTRIFRYPLAPWRSFWAKLCSWSGTKQSYKSSF